MLKMPGRLNVFQFGIHTMAFCFIFFVDSFVRSFIRLFNFFFSRFPSQSPAIAICISLSVFSSVFLSATGDLLPKQLSFRIFIVVNA